MRLRESSFIILTLLRNSAVILPKLNHFWIRMFSSFQFRQNWQKLARISIQVKLRQLPALLDGSPVKEIIYISSTSIYPELNRTVTEEDVTSPEQSAAAAMVRAENLLIGLRPSKTVSILRLGGLLGYERIPGKYVKGQKDMTTGSIPVNYIHRDDAAAIIATIIETGVVNETFNIVAPFHPTRSEVYVSSCAQFGWEAPTFKEPEETPDFKIISADKLARFYDHAFLYADPLDFHYEIAE